MKANIIATGRNNTLKAYTKKLTIGMIVKNEVKVLRRCLESLSKLRERVDLEIIITDTGSTDGSIAIAEEFADTLTHFEWCADFAKARNVAMDLAKGAWFMFIDSDEWLSDELIDELDRFFNSNEPKKYRSCRVCLRNYSDAYLKKYIDNFQARIVNMNDGQRFSTPIHETLSSYMPSKTFAGAIHHTGYTYISEKAMRAKTKRNNDLIEKMINDGNYTHGTIISYYASAPENRKDWIIEKLRLLEDLEMGIDDYNRLYSLIVNHYLETGRCYDAETALKKYFSREGSGFIDMYFFAMFVCNKLGKYEDALEYTRKYLDDLAQYNKDPLDFKYVLVTHGTEEDKTLVLCDAVFVSARLFMEDDLKFFFSSIDLSLPCSASVTLHMINAFAKYNINSSIPLLIEALRKLPRGELQNNNFVALNAFFVSALDNDSLSKMLNDQMPGDIITILFEHLRNFQDSPPLTVSLKQAKDANALPLFVLIMLLERADISEFLQDAGVDEINSIYAVFCKYYDFATIFECINCIPRSNISTTLLCQLVNSYIFGATLQANIVDKFDCANFLLRDIVAFTEQFYKNVDEHCNLLPALNRFAIIVTKTRDSSPREYLAALREAIGSSPTMKDLAEVLLEQFEASLNAAPPPNPEFVELAIKIKASIPQLVASGKASEALAVLQQLKDLVPDDKEIDELIYRCSLL